MLILFFDFWLPKVISFFTKSCFQNIPYVTSILHLLTKFERKEFATFLILAVLK